jgi:hypothetical protein
MTQWILWGVLILFGALRVLALVRFWKLPFSFGADRYFGLPVDVENVRPLLRRYRAMLLVVYLPDAVCAIGVFYFWGEVGLALEQLGAAILARVYHTLLAIHTIREAKRLAAGVSWKPVTSTAFSLKTRRLRDYTNMPFEIGMSLLSLVSLALFAYECRLRTPPGHLPELARFSAFVALWIYLQLGGLLAKHALVKWRMWLPGERTETYLNWREAARRYFLWFCDYMRAMLTLGLVVFVLAIHARATGNDWAIVPIMVSIFGVGVAVALVGFAKQKRRLAMLWKELEPLEAFSAPPEAIDASAFFLGGLCYWKAQNPALFVPGPLVYAVNLANMRAYLYSAYIAGFALLAVWFAKMPHS